MDKVSRNLHCLQLLSDWQDDFNPRHNSKKKLTQSLWHLFQVRTIQLGNSVTNVKPKQLHFNGEYIIAFTFCLACNWYWNKSKLWSNSTGMQPNNYFSLTQFIFPCRPIFFSLGYPFYLPIVTLPLIEMEITLLSPLCINLLRYFYIHRFIQERFPQHSY